MREQRIIQNAVLIKETGEFIRSSHVHDCIIRNLSNGKMVMVDGGTEYIRGSVDDPLEVESYCLTTDTPLSDIKEKLLWGTRGPTGNQPLKLVRLIDCETDHLLKIHELLFNAPEASIHKIVVRQILTDRSALVGAK